MGADVGTDWQAAARSALAWWEAAGVDMVVDELPRDWLTPPAAPAPATASPAPAPAAASLPPTLVEFLAWRLSDAAPEAPWGGARLPFSPMGASGLLVLTDVPEDEDARTGTLMSGPAGRLLDNMLAAIGLCRDDAMLASLAIARPATGRIAGTALPELAGLARHLITLAQPRALLLLGQDPSCALTGIDAARAKGSLHLVNHAGGTVAAAVMLHPRWLLGRPAAKADAWADLQMLRGDALS